MEFNTFEHSESGPTNPSATKEIAKDDQIDTDKKKKSKKSSAGLGGITTTGSLKTEKTADQTKPEPAPDSLASLLKKLRGENSEPLIEVDTAAGASAAPAEESSEMNLGAADAEVGAEAELKTMAQDITELRLHDADTEYQAVPAEHHDTPEAAAAAAHVALLRAMRDRMASNATEPVADSLVAAERSVENTITTLAEPPVEDAPEAAAEPDIEPTFVVADELPPPGPPPADRESVIPDLPPPLPPAFSVMPQPSRLAETVQPTAAVTSPGNERAAMAQGLLIGGAAGYLVGRHRGRQQGQARAEKQATPVRHDLENQVDGLQETIDVKERRIMGLAREKIVAIQAKKDRARAVRAIERSHPVEAQPLAAAADSRVEAAERPAARPESSDRLANTIESIVEAPLAVVAGTTIELRETIRRPDMVIPFDKPIERFTQPELKTAAETIKVEGTSLQEMVELGRLDEPGLRRVVNEFIRGGDVSQAVNRETDEADRRYEKDPIIRRQLAAGKAGLAGSGVAGGQAQVVAGLKPTTDDPVGARAVQPYDGPRPQPDASTIRAIRHKQIATVSGTVMIVVVVIIIALLAL